MGYGLGVDVGTTWTAAAIARPGSEPQVLALGGRAPVVPTVVHLGADGVVSVGETAERRAAADPSRVAREFKRRVGDTAPVLLGGQPWSPESLLMAVLRWVIGRATELEGEAPDSIVVTRPANWGPLRTELVEQAVAHAGIAARFVTEPEAAAIHYASATRVPDGTVVAVYDLGGGTFDATVLRKLPAGFEVLGRPEGVERLGGLDFDAAVLGHVTGLLGPAWIDLDHHDPDTAAAAARLREDVVRAKEALSEDPDASIPVHLPTVATRVRITRAEFEGMIRASVEQSADALLRAIAGAGLDVGAIDRVLLVGGSSRIPLVSQVLSARIGRPLALDTHPKHAVALGAARLAVAAAGAGAAAPVGPAGPVVPATPAAPVVEAPPAPRPTPVDPSPARRPTSPPEPAPLPATPSGPTLPRWVPIAAVAAAVVLVAGVALALAGGGNGDGEDATATSFSRAGDEPATDAALSEVSDTSGTITITVPERWDSVGPLPIAYTDTEVVAPDLVVATDEETFQSELGTPGVHVTFFGAAAIETFGVLGDVPDLVLPWIEDRDLENRCESEDDPVELEVGGFAGTLRHFVDCGEATGVEVFGGYDDDGQAIVVEAQLVDDADADDIDAVLDSVTVSSGSHSEPRAPGEVTVQVLNGSSASGSATAATEALADAGYAVVDAINLAADAEFSEVFVAPGFEIDGAAVINVLDLNSPLSPMPSVRPAGASEDAVVLVVIGGDTGG